MPTNPWSLTSRRPLPKPWVAEIFRRLQGLYGSLWTDRWRTGTCCADGNDIGIENAMAVWAEELAGLAETPERIKAALRTCRTQAMPPTLPEFLGYCLAAPVAPPPAAPGPVLSRAQMADNVARAECLLHELAQRPEPGLQWAHRLRQRYLAGDALPEVSIRYGAEVLGEVWAGRRCQPRPRPGDEAGPQSEGAMPVQA